MFFLFCTLSLNLNLQADSPLAKNRGKFLGNVIGSTHYDSVFKMYWNQVTPENAGKWGVVERIRTSYSWTELDKAYDYAQANNFAFKYHTLVWGSQEPDWVKTLDPANQKAALTKYIDEVAKRYPNIDFIDVVNEPLHAPPSYKNAIGGPSEYDWIIWAFRYAREKFPNAKLLINEYGIIDNQSLAQEYVKIISLLKKENLTDGIGIQGHDFSINNLTQDLIGCSLEILTFQGLPIYVSEFDATGTDEQQEEIYKRIFPALWEHPSIKGITIWGYLRGASSWRADSWLYDYSAADKERKALKWLKTYFESQASSKETVPTCSEKNYTVPFTLTPTPTSTPTPTRSPIPTSTPQPTPTSIPQPTPTSIPQPTPTSTPQPTPSSIPTPNPPSIPESIQSSIPEPTPTSIPEPLPTTEIQIPITSLSVNSSEPNDTEDLPNSVSASNTGLIAGIAGAVAAVIAGAILAAYFILKKKKSVSFSSDGLDAEAAQPAQPKQNRAMTQLNPLFDEEAVGGDDPFAPI